MFLRMPMVTAFACLLALCVPGTAAAQETGSAPAQARHGQAEAGQEGPGRAEIGRRLSSYFAGEKSGSLFFLGMGLAAVIGGGLMLSRKRRLLKGAAWPILVVGLIQIGVGSAVYFRTDAQVAALEAQIASAPDAFVREESARMETVAYWFDVYMSIEIALIVIAAAVFVMGHRRDRDFARGLGLGLAAQSGLVLVFDFFAAARADRYIEALISFGAG